MKLDERDTKVPLPEMRNVKQSYLPETVVGIDRRGQYVAMDKESESLEQLSYCLTLLDDGKCEKIRREVESTPHPSTLAEGPWCIDQDSGLRVREVVAKRSSGGMAWENWLVGDVGYFRMDLVVEEVTGNEVGSLKVGTSVGWNVFEFESFVVWHDEDYVSQTWPL